MRSTGGEEPHGSGSQPDAVSISAEDDGPGGSPRSAILSSAESGAEANNQVDAGSGTRAEAKRADPVVNRKSRDRPYYLKRSKAGWWLLALFMLALVVAFLLYPRRAAVYQPPPLNVAVSLFNAKTVGEIRIDVQQLSSTEASVHFSIEFSRPRSPSGLATPLVQVIMFLPNGVVPEQCAGRVTDGEVCIDNHKPGNEQVTEQVDATNLFGTQWAAYLDFTLRGQALPWNSNGLTVEAHLPILKVYAFLGYRSYSVPASERVKSLPPSGDLPIILRYWVPDAPGYDWTGGPEPNSVSSDPGNAIWVEPLRSLSAAIAVSGTDNSTAGLDSFRTLMAGTLLGVAGGALVGAIQEFTHRKENASPVQMGSPGQPN